MKLSVKTLFRKQSLVRSFLDDTSFINDKDSIRFLDC